jgi:valyl-tRNA synthetase
LKTFKTGVYPPYFVKIEGEQQEVNDGKYWVVGRTREQALERSGVVAGGNTFDLVQDEDVLDARFSSGLWPFRSWGGQRRSVFFFSLLFIFF